MAEIRFRAMGSDCCIKADGGPVGIADRGRDLVDELERRWSRFLDTSEICWLNRAAGRAALVSKTTLGLLQRAMYASHQTDGLFDPFMLEELEQLGYDQGYGEYRPGDAASARALVVDQTCLVQLPTDRHIDPGGIGKGYACDLVAQHLLDEGAENAVVAMGGDLRIVGPDREFITEIEIQDPWDRAGVVGIVRMGPGGIATSSTLWRRWLDSDGVERHHLLDPGTRQPADTDLVAVTVIAGETWWAEALSKAVVIGGSEIGAGLLERHGAAGLLTFEDGHMRLVGVGEAAAAA